MSSGAVFGLEPVLALLAFLVPALIGWNAEKIFKTSAFGRLPDAAIGLVGGGGTYILVNVLWSWHYDQTAQAFYADLVQRGIDTSGRYPEAPNEAIIMAVAAVAGIVVGSLLVWLVRQIRGRKPPIPESGNIW